MSLPPSCGACPAPALESAGERASEVAASSALLAGLEMREVESRSSSEPVTTGLCEGGTEFTLGTTGKTSPIDQISFNRLLPARGYTGLFMPLAYRSRRRRASR